MYQWVALRLHRERFEQNGLHSERLSRRLSFCLSARWLSAAYRLVLAEDERIEHALEIEGSFFLPGQTIFSQHLLVKGHQSLVYYFEFMFHFTFILSTGVDILLRVCLKALKRLGIL